MKPLDEEQREEVWKAVNQAIIDSANPRDGEFTVEQIMEATGHTHDQLRRKLKRLLGKEILGMRKIAANNTRYNVYFPLKDTSMEETLEILTN